jgi:cation:H+ antiporter
MIGASFLLLIIGIDGNIGRGDGLLFLVGILSYLLFLYYRDRRSSENLQKGNSRDGDRRDRSRSHYLLDLLLVVVGLGMLVFGSRWLIDGAVLIANILGVSNLIIGLTIVAAGTSLPEVATSVIAAVRGERDIAVGNIVGSNIFNILSVLGFSSVLAPEGIHVSNAALNFDIPVMFAVSVACLPIFFTGHIIARWEGILFLGYYIAYTAYLILESSKHMMLPVFSSVMLVFVIPITVLTLLIVTVRQLDRSKNVSGNTTR